MAEEEQTQPAQAPVHEPEEDVHMADEAHSDGPNGDLSNGLSHPKTDSPPPATVPASSLPAVSSSITAVESLAADSPYSNNSPNNDDIQPPPAKRARMHTDPDQASLANVRLFTFVRRCQGVLIQYILSFPSEERHSPSSHPFTTTTSG